MMTITEAPILYLSFASLHLIAGHFGSSLIYKLRFGSSPLALYQKNQATMHIKLSRLIGILALLWGLSIITFAYSTTFRESFLGSPILTLNPWIGWIIASIGLVGMLLSQMGMGEAFRIGQDEMEHTNQIHLKKTGIYRYSRNPIYIFSVLCLVGVSLWVITLITWLMLITMIICIHGLVLQEEKFLRRKFGQEYNEFCNNVPRYFLSIKKIARH